MRCPAPLVALTALEAEIATARERLAADEAELNQRVVDYYRLDEIDRQIIADFLARL
jgi:hypothetical protein